ncbi:ALBINO3-like protein 2, chloroplastic isoform X1 [Carex rostrata]
MGIAIRLLRRHLSGAWAVAVASISNSKPQSHLHLPSSTSLLPGHLHFFFSSSSNSADNSETLNPKPDTLTTMETTQMETSTTISDYPVELVTGFLDGYHQLTGFPWWFIISSSTVAMRFSLLPILWLQMNKVSRLAQLFPLLPPPFPPPFSGRSWTKQYLFFEKKRKKLGCPSFFWNFSYLTVQLPTFLLCMSSIRTMCLNHHSGLETGGALWFQNLTSTPHGAMGCIFPFMIAGLHYTNIQLSFESVQLDKLRGIYGLMLKYYKRYLDILSIPFFVVGLLIPQGSLVYWTTNGLFTLFQNLALRNEHVRMKLGIPNIKSQRAKFTSSSENAAHSLIAMDREVMESLSHDQLLDISLDEMTVGKIDSSLRFLEVTLEKDPDSVKALVAMSQIMFTKLQFQEAIEYAERALSKIQEDDPFHVLALYIAGLSYKSLGNKAAAINHLKRVPNLSVPVKFLEKACYYQALLLLGSYLFEEGKASEAIVHLRVAATYDPGVERLVKECEEAMEQVKASSSEEEKKSVG